MSQIIDTHVHLDFEDFAQDLNEVIYKSNCNALIIPGADTKTLHRAKEISTNYENVYFAAGIHPNNIDSLDSFNKDFEMISKACENQKCVAIGECGLDFYYFDMQNDECKDENYQKDSKAKIYAQISQNNESAKIIENQIIAFKAQIELSQKNKLPLILHVRDNKNNFLASQKVYEILKSCNADSKNSQINGVFHCYNAFENFIDFSENFYFAIGGIITFKNAKNLLDILPKIPINRLLLETDAPYLAPHPHRGKRNESKFIIHTAEKIADILNIKVEDLVKITTENAKKLFKLP